MHQLSMDMNSQKTASDPQSRDGQVPASPEPQVYSVSQINQAIRGLLEGQFPLVWIQGEISNFKAHSSGHWYFCLKDKKAQVNAVMFRGFNGSQKFRPEDGMEVLIRGRVTVYEPRGNYQIFCELMDPVGAGALQKAFEQLKAKLEKEGLFAAERKRALPPFPQHVAIVTSPTGAAIRDMLNVLKRRFSGLKITLIPAVVQGDQAPASVIRGIQLADQLKDLDVLIVGRGGGSIEDLWAFNDEGVARAIAGFRLPVISGVGHEVDFTIADFVADLRAPTPSAAAELVVKNVIEVKENLQQLRSRLHRCTLHKLELCRRHVLHMKRQLVDPRRRLQDLVQRSDELAQRLESSVFRYLKNRGVQLQLLVRQMVNPKDLLKALQLRKKQAEAGLQQQMKLTIKDKQNSLRAAAALLDSLSPLKVVDRGYAIARKEKRVIKSVQDLKAGDTLDIRLGDGEVVSMVKELKPFKEKDHGI